MKRLLLRVLRIDNAVRTYPKGPAPVARRAVRRHAHRHLTRYLRRLP